MSREPLRALQQRETNKGAAEKVAHRCSHGGPLTSTADGARKLALIEGLWKHKEEKKDSKFAQAGAHNVGEELAGHRAFVNFTTTVEYWLLKSRQIDEELVNLAFSLCIDALLEGKATEETISKDQLFYATEYYHVGLLLVNWMKVRCELLSIKEGTSTLVKGWFKDARTTCYISDMVEYLSLRAPCSCLDSFTPDDASLDEPICWYMHCGKVDYKDTKIKLCSRCKTVEYCSKECQLADAVRTFKSYYCVVVLRNLTSKFASVMSVDGPQEDVQLFPSSKCLNG